MVYRAPRNQARTAVSWPEAARRTKLVALAQLQRLVPGPGLEQAAPPVQVQRPVPARAQQPELVQEQATKQREQVKLAQRETLANQVPAMMG